MSQIPFRHIMAAHCESGTVTALLNHHGMNITEPMVFGISSGIFFAYLKTPVMDFPMFAVRSMPGQVRTKFAEAGQELSSNPKNTETRKGREGT